MKITTDELANILTDLECCEISEVERVRESPSLKIALDETPIDHLVWLAGTVAHPAALGYHTKRDPIRKERESLLSNLNYNPTKDVDKANIDRLGAILLSLWEEYKDALKNTTLEQWINLVIKAREKL